MFARLTDNFRPLAIAGSIAFAASAFAPAAVQAQTYTATDYNGGAADHGLWTNRNNNTALSLTDPHFSFDFSPVIFTLDEAGDTASLIGNAYNPIDDVWATLNINFSGYSDPLPGANTYKGPGDVNDADFFTAVAGTININGSLYDIDGFKGTSLFQYGIGANDKNASELGGSAWLLLSQNGQRLDNHVDINFALEPGAVPEPTTWAMLLLGFFGIGGTLRRKRRETKPALAMAS